MANKMGDKNTAPAQTQWKRVALSKRDKNCFDSDETVDKTQQNKYGTKYQAALATFSQYCENSTIHGVKYVGDKKRPIIERLFWLIVLVLSIYACTILIMNVWNKWQNDPVIVSFAEKSTAVWEIPFPTVTVCSETKMRRSILNFTDAYWRAIDLEKKLPVKELSDDEKKYLVTAAQVCDEHLVGDLPYNETEVEGSRLINVMSEMMPSLNDTYSMCAWRDTIVECDELFLKEVTEDGICYSFNSLNPSEIYREEALIPEIMLQPVNRTSDWDLENGYKLTSTIESYPHRVLIPGSETGLQMIVNGNIEDLDYLCRAPVQGFKIFLSTPGEIIETTEQYIRIPFDQEVVISIKPKILITSEELKKYDPNVRECYFQNEYRLRYFNVYTQTNCELECFANFTLAKCGCVKYSMPRHKDVPVCGISKLKCYEEAAEEIYLLGTDPEHTFDNNECACLPACNSISYDAEISQGDFDYQSISKDVISDTKGKKIGFVKVFFKDGQFLTYKRSELYGTTDFLANCGGLLGLFLGVSTFSIIEFIYFCTVRLTMNLQLRYNKRQSTDSQKNNKMKMNTFDHNYIPDDSTSKYTNITTHL